MSSFVPAVAAVCGGEHTLILLSDGRTLSAGACGVGFTRERDVGPAELRFRPVGTPAVPEQLVAGYYHNLGVGRGKISFTWGCGTFVNGRSDGCIPALGLGRRQHEEVTWPSRVPSGGRAVGAAAGAYHSALLTDDGRVRTFGAGQLGQLGRDARASGQRDGADLPVDGEPLEMQGLPRAGVERIGAGFYNTFAIARDGSVFCAGENQNRQCGACGGRANLFRATLVTELRGIDVRAVDGGYCHTLVVSKGGRLYSMGCSDDGQRGIGPVGGAPPVLSEVTFGGGGAAAAVRAAHAGANHSVAVLEDGSVYTWGSNEYGQLGNGDEEAENVHAPSKVEPMPWAEDGGAVAVAAGAGYAHSVVLDDRGRVWACGQGANGQLGTGSEEDELRFRRVW